MSEYALKPNEKASVRVYGKSLRISERSSITVCKAISGMNLQKGKSLLQDMVDQKRNLKGKYYTNVSQQLLGILKSCESNAEFKGLDPERMIIHASAHNGFKFYRPRRMKMRRDKMKVTNIQMVLTQG